MLLQLLRASIINQSCSPSQAGCLATTDVVWLLVAQVLEQLIAFAIRAACYVFRRQLMVADENCLSVWPRKSSHAIMHAGHQQSVIHTIRRSRYHFVGKPLW